MPHPRRITDLAAKVGLSHAFTSVAVAPEARELPEQEPLLAVPEREPRVELESPQEQPVLPDRRASDEDPRPPGDSSQVPWPGVEAAAVVQTRLPVLYPGSDRTCRESPDERRLARESHERRSPTAME